MNEHDRLMKALAKHPWMVDIIRGAGVALDPLPCDARPLYHTSDLAAFVADWLALQHDAAQVLKRHSSMMRQAGDSGHGKTPSGETTGQGSARKSRKIV